MLGFLSQTIFFHVFFIEKVCFMDVFYVKEINDENEINDRMVLYSLDYAVHDSHSALARKASLTLDSKLR